MAKTSIDALLEAVAAVRDVRQTVGKRERALDAILDRLHQVEESDALPVIAERPASFETRC